MKQQKFGKFLIASAIAGSAAVLVLTVNSEPPETTVVAHAPAPQETTTSTTQAITTTAAPAPTTSSTAPRRAQAARVTTTTEQSCYRCTIFTTTTTAPANDSWYRLGDCETGDRKRDGTIIPGTKRNANTGNGYYGYFQFNITAWREVGGTGYPHHHDYAEQKRRGIALQKKYGWKPWPACSRKLGLR